MKVRIKDLSKEQKIETLDALYTAASVLKGREATKSFLRDLLTESERIMLGRRILIARELLAGNSYAEIATSMRTGYDTIAHVGRWLNDQIPGYEEAIKKMQKEIEEREIQNTRKRLCAEDSFRGTIMRLKRKYPMHFLFFPEPKISTRSKLSRPANKSTDRASRVKNLA